MRHNRATLPKIAVIIALITGSLAAMPAAFAATSMELYGIQSPIASGAKSDMIVAVYTEEGTLDADYRGTISFSSTDPEATLPADYTFTAGDGGDHLFSEGVTLRTPGEQIVTATDGTLTDSQGEIIVEENSTDALEIFGMQSPIAVGKAGNVIVNAYAVDQSIDESYRGTVHFTSSDPEATLPPDYTFTEGDNGTHTFTAAVIFRTVGNQTVTVTDTADAELTATQTGIEVRERQPSSISLAAKKSGDKIKVSGTVTPNKAGQKVDVTLFKKKPSGFVQVGKLRKVLLDAESYYTKSLPAPDAKKCKVTARYPGDADNLGSTKSVTFSC